MTRVAVVVAVSGVGAAAGDGAVSVVGAAAVVQADGAEEGIAVWNLSNRKKERGLCNRYILVCDTEIDR